MRPTKRAMAAALGSSDCHPRQYSRSRGVLHGKAPISISRSEQRPSLSNPSCSTRARVQARSAAQQLRVQRHAWRRTSNPSLTILAGLMRPWCTLTRDSAGARGGQFVGNRWGPWRRSGCWQMLAVDVLPTASTAVACAHSLARRAAPRRAAPGRQHAAPAREPPVPCRRLRRLRCVACAFARSVAAWANSSCTAECKMNLRDITRAELTLADA